MTVSLVYPQGRLGNLIFQISAAGELAKEDGLVIALASEVTDHLVWGARVCAIGLPPRWRRRGTWAWCGILDALIDCRLVGLIEPARVKVFDEFDTETLVLRRKRGILPGLFVIRGFFQHDHYKSLRPEVSRHRLEVAEARLAGIARASRVGVHFRFGDYERWSVFGVADATLPASYYRNAFAVIEQTVGEPVYVVFSDEPDKAEAMLAEAGRSGVVCRGGSGIDDLVAMSCCSHAILSASTFAWWAAQLIPNARKMIVAPHYWLGFKSGRWFPAEIHTEAFTYVGVD